MTKNRKKLEEKPDDSRKRFEQVVQAAPAIPHEDVTESMEREKEKKESKPVLVRKEAPKNVPEEGIRREFQKEGKNLK